MKLLVILIVLLVFLPNVWACSMMPPSTRVETAEGSCHLSADSWENITQELVLERCGDLPLSAQERAMIRDEATAFQGAYEMGFDYRNLVRQPAREHETFLEEARGYNRNICECAKYSDISFEDGWTKYTLSFKDTCSFTAACHQPPAFCPGSLYGLPFYGLLAIIGVVAGLILQRVFRRKRQSETG